MATHIHTALFSYTMFLNECIKMRRQIHVPHFQNYVVYLPLITNAGVVIDLCYKSLRK